MRSLLFSAALAVCALSAGSACHLAAVPNPPVPAVAVTVTPLPGPFDYTDQDAAGPVGKLKKRIAVARFEDNLPVKDSPFGHKEQVDVVTRHVHVHQEEILPEANFVPWDFTERLVDALANTKRFVLIERKDINALLREVSFTETKYVDKEKSAKIGKILGAQIIITGAFLPNEEEYSRRSEPLALFLRMYDVETSRIVGTARATGKTVKEVIDRAVFKIVQSIDSVSWVGKIASVSGDKLFLNAGAEENVKVGDEFQLFSLGSPVTDPDTKEVIGYQEEKAGRASVVAVSDRVATMSFTEKARDVKVGDKAQFMGSSKP